MEKEIADKPKFVVGLTCDMVITDKDEKTSIIGVFDNINSSGFPVPFPRFSFFSRWVGGKGEHKIKFRLLDQEKQRTLTESPVIKIFCKSHDHANHVAWNLFTFVFENPGTFWIQVFLDNEPVNYHQLNVKKIEPDKTNK